MKANRKALDIAMATACMTPSDIVQAAEMPRTSFNNVRYGRSVRPATLGRVAKALGVTVEEIMEKGE